MKITNYIANKTDIYNIQGKLINQINRMSYIHNKKPIIFYNYDNNLIFLNIFYIYYPNLTVVKNIR